jgi:hypothetical protein
MDSEKVIGLKERNEDVEAALVDLEVYMKENNINWWKRFLCTRNKFKRSRFKKILSDKIIKLLESRNQLPTITKESVPTYAEFKRCLRRRNEIDRRIRKISWVFYHADIGGVEIFNGPFGNLDERILRRKGFWSRYDILWNGASLFLLAWTYVLLTDIIPRLWANGPDFFAAFSLLPGAIGLILGKETLERVLKGREVINGVLEKVKVPIHLRQEFTFFAVLILIWSPSFIFHQSMPQVADCLYARANNLLPNDWQSTRIAKVGLESNSENKRVSSFINCQTCQIVFALSPQQSDTYSTSTRLLAYLRLLPPDNSGSISKTSKGEEHSIISDAISQADSDLNRAVKLKPDYALAHYQIAWLNELRQNNEEAKKHYSLAMQGDIGVDAAIRLASLYLRTAKREESYIASNILGQVKSHIDSFIKNQEEQHFLAVDAWYLRMAWAHIFQSRYEEANNELKSISLPSEYYARDCLNVSRISNKLKELYGDKIEDRSQQIKLEYSRAAEPLESKWKSCQQVSSIMLDGDFLKGQAKKDFSSVQYILKRIP